MPSLWIIQLPLCPLHGPLTIPYGSSKLRTFYGDQSYFEEAFDRVFLSPSAAILHTLPASLVSSSKKKTSLEQDEIADAPQLVWSANRNHPVKLNATLQLTQDGNLTLADSDGTSVWSTGNHSVSGLNLTEDGNLVLFDRNNATVWQSFDHPTDSLLVGQGLVGGQKLTSSTSASN
ncbi:hypothetical protein ACSBR1_027818 [Camellia fascicularis]